MPTTEPSITTPLLSTPHGAEREVVRGWLRHPPWNTLAVGVFLLLACWLRLAHLETASLTHEEAWRANVAYGGIDPTWGARRLPPLQFALGWVMQHAFGRTEWWVRLPYALAGIGAVVLLYFGTRRRFGSGAAWLAVAVAAAHPVLVSCSRKAKVFSLETLMTVALVWAGVEAFRYPSKRSLWTFAVLGIVGLGLTFTASLLIAAWMPLLAYAVWRQSGSRRRALLRPFGGIALVLLLAGVGWYVWLAGAAHRGMLVNYQEVAFHAWPTDYHPAALGAWLVDKGYGTARYVLGMTTVWSPLKWGVGLAGLLAVSAGAVVWWRRERILCAFGLVLTVELIAVGALRLWPIGANQTMTFLVPLVALAAGCGLYDLYRKLRVSPVWLILLGLTVLVPVARAAKATLRPPPVEQHLRPVFAHVAQHQQAGDALFIHYETRDAYGFYGAGPTLPVLLEPADDRDQLARFAPRFDDWIAIHPRVWFVFMLRRPAERGPWLAYLREHYRVSEAYRYNDAAVYLVERAAPFPEPRP